MWGRVLCVVTGASRGIGKAIVLSAADRCGPGSVLLLLARDAAKLEEVKREVDKKERQLSVELFMCDLSTTLASDDLQRVFASAVASVGECEKVILVQNAASLGEVGKRARELSVAEVEKYTSFNFTSFVQINNLFLSSVSNIPSTKFVVNVTSGASYKTYPCFHLYAAMKAARDAFYRIMSAEEPELRILNYTPGPVVTDMQYDVGNLAWSPDLRKWSTDGTSGASNFGTPELVAEKLIDILQENKFQSGAFLDWEGKTLKFVFE